MRNELIEARLPLRRPPDARFTVPDAPEYPQILRIEAKRMWGDEQPIPAPSSAKKRTLAGSKAGGDPGIPGRSIASASGREPFPGKPMRRITLGHQRDR